MRARWRWWASALVAIVVVVGGGSLWFWLQANPLAGPGRLVRVVVHPGDSLSTIGGELHAQGVIASPLAFRIDAAVFGAPVVLPGTYQLHQRSSFAAVMGTLGAPRVSVSAGETLGEVTHAVAAVEGAPYGRAFTRALAAALARHPWGATRSLEGMIGPGTYAIVAHESAAQLLAAMRTSFDVEAAAAGLSGTSTVAGLDAYQILTAASIVQKEGYYAPNMPRVARVILNRLAGGGPLQMDATVLYALGRDGGVVTHAMLQTRSPYNTYLVAGLTPTPICTVSPTALRAVLHAPPGPWRYFTVIDASGTEAFAVTFAQQLANERLAAARGLP